MDNAATFQEELSIAWRIAAGLVVAETIATGTAGWALRKAANPARPCIPGMSRSRIRRSVSLAAAKAAWVSAKVPAKASAACGKAPRKAEAKASRTIGWSSAMTKDRPSAACIGSMPIGF